VYTTRRDCHTLQHTGFRTTTKVNPYQPNSRHIPIEENAKDNIILSNILSGQLGHHVGGFCVGFERGTIVVLSQRRKVVLKSSIF
jgi:hypothetical protein